MGLHSCYDYCDIPGIHEFVRWGSHGHDEAWAPTKEALLATLYLEAGKLSALARKVDDFPAWGDPEKYD